MTGFAGGRGGRQQAVTLSLGGTAVGGAVKNKDMKMSS